MIHRILHSRGFVSALLAMGTGAFLYYTHPFPSDHIFLRVIAMRAPNAFLSFEYLYNIALFTTPFMVFSTALSGLYIFTLKVRRHVSPGRLPRYPDPRTRNELYLMVGEVHNPRRPGPSETPRWLTIPERGLFTGIAIFGAVGSGKTSCCMYPFAEQILAYKASDEAKRIGGLILEVKGDFCRKVTLSTIHANSARQGLARFTSCVLQSGVDLPYRAIKTNIGDSLNVVVQVERRPGRRFVSEVLEINSYDPDADLYDFAAVYVAKRENP
jgi:hypothetical protein